MRTFSTRQAARQLKISLPTLNRYIEDKKIPVPPVTWVMGMRVRVWNDENIDKVRKLLPKIANGRKTRYQKKKHSAISSQQSGKAKPKKPKKK